MIPAPECESGLDFSSADTAFPARIRHPPRPIDGLENGLKSLGCRWIPVAYSRTEKEDNPNLSVPYERCWKSLEHKGRLLVSLQATQADGRMV
jgi:hypothetical protein